ncbi:MAG: peptidase M15 [Gammaproteobacteria bacterium]|nr:peptidase M15 [Gammaproteobacteria bacterium]
MNLRDQFFDVYEYGEEFEPTYLYLKSRYINEEFPHYAEQCQFDEDLENLKIFDFEGHGPRPNEFREKLKANRLEMSDFKLTTTQTIPELDDACGDNFTFRDFIECGETWDVFNSKENPIDNIPKQADTYNAIYHLATKILDPVIDYFGMVQLTYGFSSSKLAKEIPGRIAPKLDQHASCELNRLKNPICPRLGAACDFIVEYESMLEVAQWLVENTPFDRLYFYGDDKPIHVSYGPENKQEIVFMKEGKDRLIPSVIKIDKFMDL